MLNLNPCQDRLLEPEEPSLLELKPPGPTGERFHFLISESPANREARVVADHGVPYDKSREQPDAKRGESAANEIHAGGPEAGDTDHFLQDDGGVFFGKMMKGETAKDQFGALGTKRKPPGVGLDEMHFVAGRCGGAGNLEGLKLDVNGDYGDLALVGAGEPDQIPAMVAIAAGQVDQNQAVEAIGETAKDFFNGLFATERFVEARDVFKVVAQGRFILIGQIHQFGLGLGIFALHGARMPIVELASFFFCEKKTKCAV